MSDISNQTSSKSPAQNQPKTRPLYRLEKREAGHLTIVADGLTLIQSYDLMDKIAGLHIRFSYNGITTGSEVAL